MYIPLTETREHIDPMDPRRGTTQTAREGHQERMPVTRATHDAVMQADTSTAMIKQITTTSVEEYKGPQRDPLHTDYRQPRATETLGRAAHG